MASNPIPPDLFAEITEQTDILIDQFNKLSPKQRDAAMMGAIVGMTESLLKVTEADPHLTYLTLLTVMTESYETIIGKPAPKRIIQ